jgi:hypothetical protein
MVIHSIYFVSYTYYLETYVVKVCIYNQRYTGVGTNNSRQSIEEIALCNIYEYVYSYNTY